MKTSRQEKIEKIKSIMNGADVEKFVFVSMASDGNRYAHQDLTRVTYQIVFSSESSFNQWQRETCLDRPAHSPNYMTGEYTVVLKTEYEARQGARPRNGKPMIWNEDFVPNEAYQRREEIKENLCKKYLKHPPKGFEVIRQPYSKMAW